MADTSRAGFTVRSFENSPKLALAPTEAVSVSTHLPPDPFTDFREERESGVRHVGEGLRPDEVPALKEPAKEPASADHPLPSQEVVSKSTPPLLSSKEVSIAPGIIKFGVASVAFVAGLSLVWLVLGGRVDEQPPVGPAAAVTSDVQNDNVRGHSVQRHGMPTQGRSAEALEASAGKPLMNHRGDNEGTTTTSTARIAELHNTTRDPDASDALVEKARTLRREKGASWASVGTLYRQALALDDRNPQAASDYAQLLLDQGDAEGAEAWARRSIELRPKRREYHVILSEILKRQGKTAEAEAVLKKVVAHHLDRLEQKNDRLLEGLDENLGKLASTSTADATQVSALQVAANASTKENLAIRGKDGAATHEQRTPSFRSVETSSAAEQSIASNPTPLSPRPDVP